MAVAQFYNRPPIIEAVIDLKFEGDLSERDLERLHDRFKSGYPSIEEKKTIQVDLSAGGVVTRSSPAGFKMTAKNGVDLVLVNSDSIGSVRFAPYETWDNLIAVAKDNFDTFTKVVGRKIIVRIGARFINRIDIPVGQIEGKPLREFFRIGVALPTEISSEFGDYSLAVTGVELTTGSGFSIRTGIGPPVLLDHVSISLDIDVFWDKNIPSRLDELWKKTDVLRSAKNSVFENCITDHVRELFQ
jgi:uncharacterized protein (TIGR04255 family)